MRYYGLGFDADISTIKRVLNMCFISGMKWIRRVLITKFSYRDLSAVTAKKNYNCK